MPDQILLLYGIRPEESIIQAFGDGLINHTWKVSTPTARYILQKVNEQVFKNPQDIDQNISRLNEYLGKHYPGYLFVSPLPSSSGSTLLRNPSGYYRLFPYIENSHAISVASKKENAFEAAKQFGQFSRLLDGFNAGELLLTLPDFHNLSLRYHQFLNACDHAEAERKEKSAACIEFLLAHQNIADTYQQLVSEQLIPLRVIHHDTKISNVLFDHDDKGICVIDLDTVMPGYFISDVGDMMRTYLSPANEEETDFNQIIIRQDYFKAIYDGYILEMGEVLTATEKSYFIYSGKFMIYMQAMRFITDYLQNDPYYGKKYEDHNLNRCINQITLLKRYLQLEPELRKLIK